MRNYRDVRMRLAGLCAGETDDIAIMATVSQELFASFDGFDWVGFYRVVQPDLLKSAPIRAGMAVLLFHLIRGYAGQPLAKERFSWSMMLRPLMAILPVQPAPVLNWSCRFLIGRAACVPCWILILTSRPFSPVKMSVS